MSRLAYCSPLSELIRPELGEWDGSYFVSGKCLLSSAPAPWPAPELPDPYGEGEDGSPELAPPPPPELAAELAPEEPPPPDP